MDCHASNVTTAYVRQPKDSNFVSRARGLVAPDDDRYVILRCGECGSVFLHPYYWRESFAVYFAERYHRGYFPDNIHDGGGPSLTPPRYSKRSRQRFRRRAMTLLRQADRHPGPRIRVLDIGCATGLLVQGFVDLGCEGYGVDVSKKAIDNACNKDLALKLGLFEHTDYPDRFFDLIVSIETFEHMASLDGILDRIRLKLKPTGNLVLQVPNDIEGYRAMSYPRIWWMVPPMHIRYFTLQSIRAIFASNGFVVQSYRTTGSLGNDLRMILKWLLKRIGHSSLAESSLFRIFCRCLTICCTPVDLTLNLIKRHTQILVTLNPESRPDVADTFE